MSRSATIAWFLLAAFVAQPWLSAAMALSSCCCTAAAMSASAEEVAAESDAASHACCKARESTPTTAEPIDSNDPLQIPTDCDCPRNCCMGLAKSPVAPVSAPSDLDWDAPGADAPADASNLHDDPEFSRLKRPPRALSFA